MHTLFRGLIHTRPWNAYNYTLFRGFIHVHEQRRAGSQQYLPCSVASYTSINNVGKVPRNAYPVPWHNSYTSMDNVWEVPRNAYIPCSVWHHTHPWNAYNYTLFPEILTLFCGFIHVHEQRRGGSQEGTVVHWWTRCQRGRQALKELTHKGVNQRSKYVTQVQQRRPESPTVTLTWHACK